MKLLITSAVLLILSTVTVHGSAVYDVSGEPLKSGTYYHITSAIRGGGGGGLFPLLRPQPCPRHIWGCSLNVAQSPTDLNLGLPVTLYPLNPSDNIVLLNSDVKIEFNFSLPLNEPATWQLENADESTGMRYVTIGGYPTPANEKNKWFKIEKVEDMAIDVYTLKYCPSVPRSDDTCGYLGLTFNNGGRWLALSNRPLLVVFIKAESSGKIRSRHRVELPSLRLLTVMGTE